MHAADDAPENEATEEGDAFDPRTAAALLEQTREQAQRQFDIRPPLVMLFMALVVLLCYGDIWVSVRGQHPYVGPSGTALAVLYAIVAVAIVVLLAVRSRASRGIGGRSARQQGAAAIAFGIIWVLVYVFDGALSVAGAGPAIIYGLYPAAAPLIIVGGAAAAYTVAREEWGWSALALAVVALAALAAYTGPATAWGVIGLGFSLLLVARAASQLRQWQGPAWARSDGR
jgi:hypothetical protein